MKVEDPLDTVEIRERAEPLARLRLGRHPGPPGGLSPQPWIPVRDGVVKPPQFICRRNYPVQPEAAQVVLDAGEEQQREG
jgi:hypothetical protein